MLDSVWIIQRFWFALAAAFHNETDFFSSFFFITASFFSSNENVTAAATPVLRFQEGEEKLSQWQNEFLWEPLYKDLDCDETGNEQA